MLGSVASWFAKRHDTYQPPFIRGMRRVKLAWNVVEITPERQRQKLAAEA